MKFFKINFKELPATLSKFYPLFFTVIFIAVILQYSFSSLESVLYDLRVRWDVSTQFHDRFVLVTLDEESDQFLGEVPPYSYATHNRLIKRIVDQQPAVINYFVNLNEAESKVEEIELKQFKGHIQNYMGAGGAFRFGTDMDTWGEILPPEKLTPLGYSLALLNQDNSQFAKDGASRRAILDISGDESLHLWSANAFRKSKGEKPMSANQYLGNYYVPEAEARFALFRYFTSPLKDKSAIKKISAHRVVVGSFPQNYFKDKIVLIGPEYLSNTSEYILTPYNKEKLDASKLNVHAQIINALVEEKTIFELPRSFSSFISICLGIFLSFVISRLQPAKGLYITVITLLGVILSCFVIFSLMGIWIYMTHLILTIFIVYYIWVPFRAIDEYQTRYKIQEESKLLRKVDDLKRNFISLMSHDLKTPVAKIAGLADILINQFKNLPEQGQHLLTIVDTTKELNRFITSILDLTKVESKNVSLETISKDINKIVDVVCEELRFEAKRAQVVVETDLGPLYPIQIDPNLMKRVLSNLIENAIKYSGKDSEVFIKTWDDDDFVYVSVKDTGVGISPENLENIFEKFYRVKNDANYSIKGSGLGLYLVRYFIELHDGEIGADSTLGEGTTFTMKLKNQ